MPRKPKSPCSYPGCPKLTEGRFCAEHQRIMNAQYEKYERNYKPGKRYGRTWKRIRDRYALQHPLCEKCLENGAAVPMAEVHHIIPLVEGGSNDDSNLMALCRTCHSRIHIERGDRWQRKGNYKKQADRKE